MRIFVTGASGFVGENVARDLVALGHVVVPGRRGDGFALESPTIPEVDAVVHCAALAKVQACADDPARAEQLNVVATRTMAREATRRGIPLVFTSTDLVFDGTRPPYDVSATPSATSVYGHTKIDAERAVLEADQIVVRLALVVGAHRDAPGGFLSWMLAGLTARRPVPLYTNQIRTPLWASDVAPAIDVLLRERRRGIHHLASATPHTREEIGRLTARTFGVPDESIVRTTLDRDDDCTLIASPLLAFTPLETALLRTRDRITG